MVRGKGSLLRLGVRVRIRVTKGVRVRVSCSGHKNKAPF